MPGFSHGTAGAAYALAAAGRALTRRDLVDVAIRGAEAILAAGDQPGGWAVPLAIPLRPGRPKSITAGVMVRRAPRGSSWC